MGNTIACVLQLMFHLKYFMSNNYGQSEEM